MPSTFSASAKRSSATCEGRFIRRPLLFSLFVDFGVVYIGFLFFFSPSMYRVLPLSFFFSLYTTLLCTFLCSCSLPRFVAVHRERDFGVTSMESVTRSSQLWLASSATHSLKNPDCSLRCFVMRRFNSSLLLSSTFRKNSDQGKTAEHSRMLRRCVPARFACCTAATLFQSSGTVLAAAAAGPSCSGASAESAVSLRPDNCFEVRTTHVKFGRGALLEIAGDCVRVGGGDSVRRVAVITDPCVATLECVATTLQKLRSAGIDAVLYDSCAVEPSDSSFAACGDFLRSARPDVVVSVGGGSAMDTAKAGLLWAKFPRASMLEYIGAPVGGGCVPPGPLTPHIAVPTTVGTGAECTGIAICGIDLHGKHCKSGMSHPLLIPTMAVVDPSSTATLPKAVIAASGYDVLSHAVESYTALPYSRRLQGFPSDPRVAVARPVSGGSNPFSDMGCVKALELIGQHYVRAVNMRCPVALEGMALAAMIAGTAMGNAGCHLPHAMSYPLSGNCPTCFSPPAGYPSGRDGHGMLPHGYAVALNAPSVVGMMQRVAGPEVQQRLAHVAELLQPLVTCREDRKDAAAVMKQLMADVGIPYGIRRVGFNDSDIKMFVAGAFVQARLVKNAPWAVSEAEMGAMFQAAMD